MVQPTFIGLIFGGQNRGEIIRNALYHYAMTHICEESNSSLKTGDSYFYKIHTTKILNAGNQIRITIHDS